MIEEKKPCPRCGATIGFTTIVTVVYTADGKWGEAPVQATPGVKKFGGIRCKVCRLSFKAGSLIQKGLLKEAV